MSKTPRDPLATLLALLILAKSTRPQETVVEFEADFDIDDDGEYELDEIDFDPDIDEIH